MKDRYKVIVSNSGGGESSINLTTKKEVADFITKELMQPGFIKVNIVIENLQPVTVCSEQK